MLKEAFHASYDCNFVLSHQIFAIYLCTCVNFILCCRLLEYCSKLMIFVIKFKFVSDAGSLCPMSKHLFTILFLEFH